MKVLISLAAVLALASAQDWTCEECEEGGHAAAAFLSTEQGISTQTEVLVTDTCPEHPDPEYCGEHMGEWWGAIGPIVWHEHFEYICDDLDCPEHNHTMRASVPSCEACVGRVNGASDALAWEETIAAWVGGLAEWCRTEPTIPDVEECVTTIEWGIPLAFPALVAAPRDWVTEFCTEWGACSA